MVICIAFFPTHALHYALTRKICLNKFKLVFIFAYARSKILEKGPVYGRIRSSLCPKYVKSNCYTIAVNIDGTCLHAE